MAFAYNVTAASNVPQALTQDVNYALQQWSSVLQASGTLNVSVEVSPVNITRAGAPVNMVYAGSSTLGRPMTMTSAASALLNNQHVPLAGTNADMIIRFDPTYLADHIFLDSTPTTSNDIPANKQDGITVIQHEIAHGLGMTGYYPMSAESSIDLTAPLVSTFDRWVVFDGKGGPLFYGPNAMAANGGRPVPLTNWDTNQPGSEENFYHFGTGTYITDFMNGSHIDDGKRYAISDLDKAVIKDVSGLSGPTQNFIAGSEIKPLFIGNQSPSLQKLAAQMAPRIPPAADSNTATLSLSDLFAEHHMTANDLLPPIMENPRGAIGHMVEAFGAAHHDFLTPDKPNFIADLVRSATA